MALEAGSRLGPYEVVGLLGSGGMGEVYRARDPRLKRHVGVYDIVLIYAGLGERDQAFDWLETAYTAGDQGMLYLKVDPPLDPLRSDPRFQDLLRRMDFPS